jgi:3-oxoacyl-[acyl-carrier-protein] synthase-3
MYLLGESNMNQKTRFESLGIYLPPKQVTTESLISQLKSRPEFDLETITGIRNRLWKQDQDDSYTMAIDAAEDCLRKSRYQAEDLDIIISSSISRFIGQSKNYYEPSLSLKIKQKLGAHRAITFDVSNACAGMFTAIYFLDALIKSGAVRNGMVVNGEWVTSIAESAVNEVSSSFDPQFGSLTVGDSGAALIIDKAVDDEDYIECVELLSTAEYAELAIGKPSNISNKMAMYADNTKMHTEDRLKIWPDFQMDTFARMGQEFKSDHYDFIIHHQVGTKFIHKVQKVGAAVCEMPMPATLSVVEEYGNTSTTSHMLVLHDNLKNGKIKKGAKILFVPAGSGFVTGVVTAKISNLEV